MALMQGWDGGVGGGGKGTDLSLAAHSALGRETQGLERLHRPFHFVKTQTKTSVCFGSFVFTRLKYFRYKSMETGKLLKSCFLAKIEDEGFTLCMSSHSY